MLLWVIIGFVAGWLINVIADRAPLRLSLTVPRCPECDTPRPFRQWSGLIAYFTGQSLCLHCRRRIAFRWALV